MSTTSMAELEERNVGHYDHSSVQQEIWLWFHMRAKEWRVRSVIEQRTRVATTRVRRIPDVSVFSRSTPVEQIFSRPHLMCCRSLLIARRQAFPHGQEDHKTYIDFGVPNVWIVDPQKPRGMELQRRELGSSQKDLIVSEQLDLSSPRRTVPTGSTKTSKD